VRDHNNQTGNERKIWRFYEAMNPVMADKHTSTPLVMIDTSVESPVSFDNGKGDESDEEKDESEKKNDEPVVSKAEDPKKDEESEAQK